MKLTSRQQQILDFIRNTLEVMGAPPTRAEISNAFGFASPNAAEDHLKALAKKGVITLEPGSARGIRLVEQLGLPLIGRVAAGSPILAVENVDGRYAMDPGMFSPRADFLLKVRGVSMINIGIHDGDLLIVDRALSPTDGKVVIAALDGELTVKRLSGPNHRQADQLIQVMDAINQKMGKQSLHFAGAGFNPRWAMKRSNCSPAYTTDIHQLARAVAR